MERAQESFGSTVKRLVGEGGCVLHKDASLAEAGLRDWVASWDWDFFCIRLIAWYRVGLAESLPA